MTASSSVKRKAPGLSMAEPKFVVRQFPVDARRGIGDRDHVEHDERNEGSGERQWNGLRERELSNPVGHPGVTTSGEEGASRRDVRPRSPTGREA